MIKSKSESYIIQTVVDSFFVQRKGFIYANTKHRYWLMVNIGVFVQFGIKKNAVWEKDNKGKINKVL